MVRGAVALILLVAGCEADSREIFVDVTTDYVPGSEFTRVRTDFTAFV